MTIRFLGNSGELPSLLGIAHLLSTPQPPLIVSLDPFPARRARLGEELGSHSLRLGTLSLSSSVLPVAAGRVVGWPDFAAIPFPRRSHP